MKWTERILASTDSEAVIILGMGPQALYLLRALHQTGKRVFLIGSKSYYGYLSRYGTKLVREDDEAKNREVYNICEEYGKDTPVLIGGGAALNFALSYLDDNVLNIFPRPFSNLNILNQKTEITNWLCMHSQLSDYYLPTYSWNQMHNQISYPVLAKWNTTTSHSFKTKILAGLNDWDKFSVNYGTFAEDLVFQPYIRDKRLYYLGGWFQNGQLKEHVLVEEIRQNPVGTVSYMKAYEGKHYENIHGFIEEIMKVFPVTGFVQFEFIEDVSSRKLYFLECNARPWGSMDVLNFRGNRRSGEALHLIKDLSNIGSSTEFFERIKSCINSDILNFRWSDPLPFLAPLMNQFNTHD